MGTKKIEPITCWSRAESAEDAQCAAFDPSWAPEIPEDVPVFPNESNPSKVKLFKVTISAVEYKPRKRVAKKSERGS